MSTRVANLLIAGVTKAGTTSLFSYLVQHPDICGSSTKETEFFSPLLYDDGPRPLDDYAKFFRHCAAQRYLVEATPNYWYGGARLIDATETLLQQPRYIVSLRDPVTRFASEFAYMQSKALIPNELSAATFLDRCEKVWRDDAAFTVDNRQYRTLATGFYVDHLGPLLERLGERLRVVFFERLTEKPATVTTDLCAWLGLDINPVANFDFSTQNATGAARSATLQRAALSVMGLRRTIATRAPALHKALATVYRRANIASRAASGIDDETRARVSELYASANARLAETLAAAGYDDVPEWVAQHG